MIESRRVHRHGSPHRLQRRGPSQRARDPPRRSHADWEPSPDRADPVDVVEQESATRVPELVPIRYGRMLVSPFTFFRGAAAIMAADLAGSPATGIKAQLCGDAHLSNFGVFGAPDRRLVFDINDFDETHEGPWEWDVKRLVASVEIAGRDRDFRSKHRRAAVVADGTRLPRGDAVVRRDDEPRRLVLAAGGGRARRRRRRARARRHVGDAARREGPQRRTAARR